VYDFVFWLPTRVIFGAGAIDSVGDEARGLGRHALVVTGTTFARRSGLIDRLRTSLGAAGVDITLYDGIGPNPRVSGIDEASRLARERGVDFVLGLGGGSVVDAAKGIAVGAFSGHSIWDYTRHEAGLEALQVDGALPIVQVPIIASTGSEANSVAVVFDEASRVKAPISSPYLYARVAIVDPILTFTVPARYTAVGGMNIVSQMLERYLTSDEFPVTDRITEGLVRVVMDSLPRAMRRGEDLDARNNLSWVAVLASTLGSAGRNGSTPVRDMAQALSAHFDIEYGSATTALWSSYTRYVLANRLRLPQVGRFKRYALLGRQLFGVHETDDEVAAETSSHRLINWLKSMDMPTNLHQIGIEELDREEVAQVAEQAVLVAGNGHRLPGGLSVEDVEHIYEGALRPA
jgi:alcohol dehydrogenase YqhD (iron-dependent ADH family)